MHIEGVSTRSTSRPTRSGQRLATHHGPESVEQGLEQAGFDRGKRDPLGSAAKHTIAIEHRTLGAMTRAPGEDGRTAGVDIGLTGGKPNPILGTIDQHRGRFIAVDHDQTGNPLRSEQRTAFRIAGEGDEGDIHGGEPRVVLFPVCFVDVKAWERRRPMIASAARPQFVC